MKAREFAWEALCAICLENTYSNLYLRKHLDSVEEADRSLATMIIYGTLQNARLCRYEWSDFVKRKPDDKIALLLDMSVYQLLFMEKIPSYAIINDAVELAKKKSHAKVGNMVNAILRNVMKQGKKEISGNFVEKLALETSHPEWIVQMWKAQYGEEICKNICFSNMETKPQSARVNTLKTTKEEVLKDPMFEEGKLAKYAVVYKGTSIASTTWYKEGKQSIQDEASQLVAEVLDPKPKESILDVCAAPGTKSMHIAQLMENKGELICGDIHEHRVKLMEESAQRLGVKIVNAKCMDATVLDGVKEDFDRVLCDVPCSGYGVLSRKSDIKYHMKSEDMDTLLPLQQSILQCASAKVKQGGILVYSTCTLNKKENEKQVAKFLKEHEDFILLEERTIFPFEYNSDGFYMAKMQRKG